MTKTNFLRQFSITTLLTALLLTVLYCIPRISPFLDLGLLSWCIFSILSVLVFYLGSLLVNHPERTKFISLTIANMLVKMLISIGLVWMYFTFKKPSDSLFILPFLLIYGIFTIFETRFLLQIANQKK